MMRTIFSWDAKISDRGPCLIVPKLLRGKPGGRSVLGRRWVKSATTTITETGENAVAQSQGQSVCISQLQQHAQERVTLHGWVTHYRSSGKIDFLTVRDGTGTIQCIARGAVQTDLRTANLVPFSQESAVEVWGVVRLEARAPGGVELEVESITVVQDSIGYPITPKEHGIDFLMDHRHLWIRSERQAAILRIRAAVIRAIRGFLDGNGFVVADPPILGAAAAEGTTTLFPVDYFGDPAYLSQSGQLYMEALALALGKVYAFGPTFRAEKSKTRRHLSEFWMVEPEIAFCDFEQNLQWQEALVAAVVADVLRESRMDLEHLGRDVASLERVTAPFPRMTYDEALEFLASQGLGLAWGEDFGAPHETALAAQFDRPVFITHFPAAFKAFYMRPDPDRPEVVLAADLLAPEGYGEIAGGSERIADLEVLQARMAAIGMDSTHYQWYLDLRRWGSVPHAGFGIGLERLVAWIAGLDHVREAIPFPRTLKRLWP